MAAAPKSPALPPSCPPRGLSRLQAAEYIGISPSKFDGLVDDGRMPQPKRIDGRVVWDRHALDWSFDQLSVAEGNGFNPWDSVGKRECE